MYSLDWLRSVKVYGPEPESIEEFFETGDPSVFASPGALDYKAR